MRIATWNIERPRLSQQSRRRRISEWLSRIDADVWILTETCSLVRPGLSYLGVATVIPDRPQAPEENWTTIWSRFPIQPLAQTSDPARAISALILLPGGTRLIVYGTVLPWLGSRWGDSSNGSTSFERALDAQSADWDRLRRENPDAEFCVAGDLNQDLAPRHYYGSRRHRVALESSLRRVGLTCLTAAPNDPVERQTHGQRAAIDHICVSSGLAARTKSTTCWPETSEADGRLSDHFGVCVEFTDDEAWNDDSTTEGPSGRTSDMEG